MTQLEIVFSLPEEVSEPLTVTSQASDQHSSVFPVCVLTRGQQKKLGYVHNVNLSASFQSYEEPYKEISDNN